MIDFKQYRSILCLNGMLPEAPFFASGLPIIAADGAANHLMQMGIKPEIVIGDLDSVLPELLPELNTHYHYDQNFCDFEKSLEYLEKNNLLPTIVVGIHGGFLDHILNNINIFMKTHSLIYAPPILGFVLRAGEHKQLNLPLNTKISLIGIPEALISSKGLNWELSSFPLSFPGSNSCFNRTISESIELSLEKGQALILIYSDYKKININNQ